MLISPSAADLGYGEAIPSSANLGSGTATPSAEDLGYGAEPQGPLPAELEYEEAPRARPLAARRRLSRSTWRNSLDCTISGMNTETQPFDPTSRIAATGRRRLSMDHAYTYKPSHHTRAPRRSSMTSSSECKKTAQERRVSFGGSSEAQVSRLHNGTLEDKNQMWYDTRELNKMRQTIGQIIRQEIDLDEDQDCWRGLETWVRKYQGRQRVEQMEDDDVIDQLIHHCQRQLAFGSNTNSKRESRDPHTYSRHLHEWASRTENNRGAQDAAEALAIYMETMDSEQVHACFPSSATQD